MIAIRKINDVNLLQSQEHIDCLYQTQNERLPCDQISDPVKHLSVQYMRLFPSNRILNKLIS